MLKESRSTAFVCAGGAHLTLRHVLCTKLQLLVAAMADSPMLLCQKMPALLTCLKLAREEVTWWATISHDLPRYPVISHALSRSPTISHDRP